jgi:hypothetical protein
MSGRQAAVALALMAGHSLACGSSAKSHVDSGVTADSGPLDAGIDAGTPDADICGLRSAYGALGFVAGSAYFTGMNIAWLGRIPGPVSPSPTVTVDIGLAYGTGHFDAGINPGTYQISVADMDWSTCSICVFLAADDGMPSRKCYIPTSGTLVLSQTNNPLTGSLHSAVFQHATCDTFAKIPDACATTIDTLDFSSPIAPSSP